MSCGSNCTSTYEAFFILRPGRLRNLWEQRGFVSRLNFRKLTHSGQGYLSPFWLLCCFLRSTWLCWNCCVVAPSSLLWQLLSSCFGWQRLEKDERQERVLLLVVYFCISLLGLLNKWRIGRRTTSWRQKARKDRLETLAIKQISGRSGKWRTACIIQPLLTHLTRERERERAQLAICDAAFPAQEMKHYYAFGFRRDLLWVPPSVQCSKTLEVFFKGTWSSKTHCGVRFTFESKCKAIYKFWKLKFEIDYAYVFLIIFEMKVGLKTLRRFNFVTKQRISFKRFTFFTALWKWNVLCLTSTKKLLHSITDDAFLRKDTFHIRKSFCKRFLHFRRSNPCLRRIPVSGTSHKCCSSDFSVSFSESGLL